MMLPRQWPSRGRRFIVEVNERPIPMPVTNTRVSAASVPAPASTQRVALAVMTTLFFMWGFVTVLNDVLVPHLKSIFDLSYTKVMLIQFAFFSAYFIFSIPSARVLDWIGYKRTIVVGLVTVWAVPMDPNWTLVTALRKLVPVMVTWAPPPAAPNLGATDVTVGAGVDVPL